MNYNLLSGSISTFTRSVNDVYINPASTGMSHSHTMTSSHTHSSVLHSHTGTSHTHTCAAHTHPYSGNVYAGVYNLDSDEIARRKIRVNSSGTPYAWTASASGDLGAPANTGNATNITVGA